MSNQQTIDDLRQAIKALEEQDSSLVARQNVTSESIIQITQQIEQISREAARLPFNSPERIALNQQARDLDDRRRVLRAQNDQLSQQINDIDAQIQRYERQIDRLENGLPLNEPQPVTETVTTSEGTTTITGDPFNDENTTVTQDQVVQGDPFNDPATVIRTPPVTDPYNSPNLFGDERNDQIDAIGGANAGIGASVTPDFEGDGAVSVLPQYKNPLNQAAFEPPPDWRVRLSLSSKSDYLYNAPDPGILMPLRDTGGVIYPYTPQINVTYNASYDAQQITHSNYKFYTYQGSSIESIAITGDFTAQSIPEANYLLAVIHFFRSATKMFYGQDQNPSRGIPPPLLYLSGHGAYQFDKHPVVISNFTYNLPNDVDYINAYPTGATIGINGESINQTQSKQPQFTNSRARVGQNGLSPGGAPPPPRFVKSAQMAEQLTRVPTKISISLTLLPMMSRYAVSNQFSLRDYASGKLLRGSKNPNLGGGAW